MRRILPYLLLIYLCSIGIDILAVPGLDKGQLTFPRVSPTP